MKQHKYNKIQILQDNWGKQEAVQGKLKKKIFFLFFAIDISFLCDSVNIYVPQWTELWEKSSLH